MVVQYGTVQYFQSATVLQCSVIKCALPPLNVTHSGISFPLELLTCNFSVNSWHVTCVHVGVEQDAKYDCQYVVPVMHA